jgi:protein-L-isoaspartate(D-aspartate) O-methyltransferase
MDFGAENGQGESESLLVRRLIEQGIREPRVLAAFASVPRAKFVPEHARIDSEEDRALDIGCGQTISQPFVVARMTEALQLRGDERVLEVGTGSGYQTAILAEMLPPPNRIYSIEFIPELAERARRVLTELGYSNVEVQIGDGALGWPQAAPFDAILVAAAPPEVPQSLLDQLSIGGRMVIPVGPTGGNQELELWRRVSHKEFERKPLFAVRFVPLVGRGGGGLH